MPTPRPLSIFVAGATFTALLFALPLAWLGLPARPLLLVLATLPLLVLVGLLFRPASPALSHLAFPLSHLPLLLVRPELTGPRVYGGATGLVALLAVIGAGAAFVVAVNPRLDGSRFRPEPWSLAGLALVLAPTLALFLPALATASAPWGSLLAVALAPLLAWWLVARVFARDVALPALETGHRVRALYRLRERSRPRTPRLVLASVLTVLALALSAFWYLWSPR